MADTERQLKPWPVANIVYDIQTGDFTAYPVDWRPAAHPLWLNNNTDPCQTGGTLGLMDDPDLDGDSFGDIAGISVDVSPSDGEIPPEHGWFLWWGNIEPNTVASHVVLAYATMAPDLDEDEDGIGDGIPGFDLEFRFADGDTGFGGDFFCTGFSCGRYCVIELNVQDLPGAPPNIPPGYVATYLLTLDLSDAPSNIFELGDTDCVDDSGSGNSGCAIYGFATGVSEDQSGRPTFSYMMKFNQTQAASRGATAFLATSEKAGSPGDRPPSLADATGVFDAYDVYIAPNGQHLDCCTDFGWFFSTVRWFGGFDCAHQPDPIPYASGFLELYGEDLGCQSPCNSIDLGSPCGIIDFTDVLAYLTHFGDSSAVADIAPPLGVLDFSDVIAFLNAFAAGCP